LRLGEDISIKLTQNRILGYFQEFLSQLYQFFAASLRPSIVIIGFFS